MKNKIEYVFENGLLKIPKGTTIYINEDMIDSENIISKQNDKNK